MLNPGLLRRMSEGAAERIGRQRQLEEQRHREEVEARELEQEKCRLLELDQIKHRVAVDKALNQTITLAIKAAAGGERNACIALAPEVAESLVIELDKIGMAHSLSWVNARHAKLMRRLGKLIDKLEQDPLGDTGKSKLIRIQQLMQKGWRQQWADSIQEVIDDIHQTPHFGGLDAAILYFNLDVKPLLEFYVPHVIEVTVEVSWKPKDVANDVLSDPHQLPSWLLSTSGAGLMQSLGACMVMDAEYGKTESKFELVELPVRPERWGQNLMTKFVHHGQPVGVSPFSASVFSRVIEAIGFRVVVPTETVARTLKVRW